MGSPNNAVEQPAGAHSLAAAAHRGRWQRNAPQRRPMAPPATSSANGVDRPAPADADDDDLIGVVNPVDHAIDVGWR